MLPLQFQCKHARTRTHIRLSKFGGMCDFALLSIVLVCMCVFDSLLLLLCGMFAFEGAQISFFSCYAFIPTIKNLSQWWHERFT